MGGGGREAQKGGDICIHICMYYLYIYGSYICVCIYISVQQKHNTIKQLYSNNKRKMIVKEKKKSFPLSCLSGS